MAASALLVRIDNLKGDVRRALNVLSGQVLSEALVRTLRGERMKRARAEFIKELEAAQGWLERDRQDVAQSVPLETCWRAFESHRVDVDRLLRESLAFIEGAVVRSQQIDNEFCAIADGLIAELDAAAELGWRRFTLMADGESFSDLADIIRVRFPAGQVWDLPVAAHEFGHYAAGRLTVRAGGGTGSCVPFEELRAEERARVEQQNREWTHVHDAHLHEYYADAFAAFTVGPAYACTCLRLRFNPATALASPDAHHPPDSQRADLILAVLRGLARRANEESFGAAHAYEPLLTVTERFWQDSVADAMGAAPPPADPQILALARRLYEVLERRREMRFGRWSQAQVLSVALGARRDPADLVTPEVSLIDVMNGAWHRRLATPNGDMDDLSAAAMAVASTMLAARVTSAS